MSSKPMLHTLKGIMQDCLIQGTKAHQHGITVSTEKEAGEVILVFLIDSKEGRKVLNMQAEGIQICDFLYCFAKYNIKEETICLLELEGRNVDDAVAQVIDTRKFVLELTRAIFGRDHQRITLKACICFKGSPPRGGQKAVDKLKEVFGPDKVRIKHRSRYDIGPFLREE